MRGHVHCERARIAGAELVAQHAGEEPAGGPDFCDLLEEVHATVHEDGDARSEGVDRDAPREQRAHDAADLDEAEGHLFDCVEAPVADVVGVFEKRVEAGHLLAAEGDRIHGQAQAQIERHVDRVAGVLAVEGHLEHGAPQARRRDSPLAGDTIKPRERERGLEGVGEGDAIERQIAVELAVVVEPAQGDALGADRVLGEGVIRVEAAHRRGIADDVEARLAFREQVLELRVRARRIAFARELALDPAAALLRVSPRPPRVGEAARISQPLGRIPSFEVARAVDRLQGNL